MDKLVVNGGKKLFGTAVVPAAKNALLPIIAASLMLDGESCIKNCPDLSDIRASRDIINSVGSTAVMHGGDFSVVYADSDICSISHSLCTSMRSSVLYLAPLLYRRGKVTISLPGGCNIGARPVDIHLDGLCRMGAKAECIADSITLTAAAGLKGINYKLRIPSVGATQTLIMAAATAKGLTILKNCAREPEVADLVHFLNCAGAKITGAGKSEIMIQGVESLCGVEYTPIADRIFAATVLAAVNACRGICLVKNYPVEYMESFEKQLKKTGLCIWHLASSALVLKTGEKAADIQVHTGYYPAFSTDMGPLLSAALVNGNGTLTLYETVFENRFSYMEEFIKLGLCCRVQGREYYQTKRKDVYIANLAAKDLRAGAAAVVAALAKRGCFTIEGVNFIDRGYEKIEQVFSALGADIRRVSVDREKANETE
ncbi:MAG: UDP-N-acetylglucosamine 1-carboxyvinyltransferase [Oscillospiraceae bacterium]|nr:UDP-N-acetylglucosamine 1-carboxyvinyltransferase [Oscillospiraceae bacterium]